MHRDYMDDHQKLTELIIIDPLSRNKSTPVLFEIF